MLIANANRLIHHFETVVDVKLFTPAEIITIIETCSCEIPEGDKLVFSREGNDIIVTNITQATKFKALFGGREK